MREPKPIKTPVVSVLIPTYKYARFLPEAIDSVLSQTFQDFELLIVDDCSPDNTAEVVAPYCQRDLRVRFEVNPTNLGMTPNWNYCLTRARGKYVKYLFGDDRLEGAQSLEKMVAMLESHPEARLAACARKIIDRDSRCTEVLDDLGSAGYHDGKRVIVQCLAGYANLIGEPSAVLFRKTDAQRGFNLAHRQFVDLEMWFHLIENGGLIYTREPLCCFRRHDDQQTAVNRASQVGPREFFQILAECTRKGWLDQQLSDQARFRIIRTLTKMNAKDPNPECKALADRLREGLGAGAYFLSWLQYVIGRAA